MQDPHSTQMYLQFTAIICDLHVSSAHIITFVKLTPEHQASFTG